jgi:hypothetical protein
LLSHIPSLHITSGLARFGIVGKFMPTTAGTASNARPAFPGPCKGRANYLKPKEIRMRSIVAALDLRPAPIYLKLKTLGIRAGANARRE